jgi:hypothetical protein
MRRTASKKAVSCLRKISEESQIFLRTALPRRCIPSTNAASGKEVMSLEGRKIFSIVSSEEVESTQQHHRPLLGMTTNQEQRVCRIRRIYDVSEA